MQMDYIIIAENRNREYLKKSASNLTTSFACNKFRPWTRNRRADRALVYWSRWRSISNAKARWRRIECIGPRPRYREEKGFPRL